MTDATTMLRVVFSLAIVVGLMWIVGRLMRRSPIVRSGQVITVIGRQQLGRKASVAMLKIGDKAVLVGVTDDQVTFLGEHPVPETEAEVEVRTDIDLADIDLSTPGTEIAVPPRRAPDATPRQGRGTSAQGQHAEGGALAGSLLSPTTWKQTIDALREKTVR
jgi:flagellar protein FliO/FliZ